MDNLGPILVQLGISFIPAACLLVWFKISFIEEPYSFRIDHRKSVSDSLAESFRVKLIITSVFLFFQSIIVSVFAADAFIFVFVLAISTVNFTAIVCLWTDYKSADQVVKKIRDSRSITSYELLKSEIRKFVDTKDIEIDSVLKKDDSNLAAQDNDTARLSKYFGTALLIIFPILAVSWIYINHDQFVLDFIQTSKFESFGLPIIDSVLTFALANYSLGAACAVEGDCSIPVQNFVDFTTSSPYRTVLFAYFLCTLFPIFRLLSSLREYRALLREGNTGDLGLETDVVQTLGLALAVLLSVIISLMLVQVPIGEIGLFSGIVAAALSLAMKDTLGNLMAGALLIWDGSLKKGDVITIPQTDTNDTGSTYGIIREMRMRYTVVEDRNTVRRLIPNSMLVTDPIESWTHEHSKVRLSLKIGVGYKTDLPKAKQIMEAVCYDVGRIMTSKPPQALVVNFGDHSIDFSLRFWLRDTNAGIRPVISEVLMAIKQKFDDEEIEIPFPQQDLWIRNDDLSKVVSFGVGATIEPTEKAEKVT